MFDIPALPAVDVPLDGCKFVRFDMAFHESHPENEIIHFFTSDPQFDRLWRDPERYVPMLSRFRAVVAPDFSIYTDFPKACQIFNHFRKHWLGKFLVDAGLTVIPCPRWVMGDQDAFGWCLDGEPTESTICISTHGVIQGKEQKREFLTGWHEALARLRPNRVYIYGDIIQGMDCDCETIHISNEVMANKRRYRHGSR